MQFRTVDRPSHGRRSKLDIVGDILQVIAEGSQRPTNIMFKANLTWPLTIAYLEVLLRHKMITREGTENKFVYRIAPKGADLLRSYVDVEEGAAELELDQVDLKLLFKMATNKGTSQEAGPLFLDTIRESFERIGYHGSPTTMQGQSGTEHRFDLVMSNREGAKVGIIAAENVTELVVMRAFVLQIDCEVPVQVASMATPTQKAVELAQAYGLKLISIGNRD